MNFNLNDFLEPEIWPGEAKDTFNADNNIGNINVAPEKIEIEGPESEIDWDEIEGDLDEIENGGELVDLEDFEAFIYSDEK